MSVTVLLPPEALHRLEAEAARRGVTLDELIVELAAGLPAESAEPRRNPSFVAVGASEGGISDRIDDLLDEGFGRD